MSVTAAKGWVASGVHAGTKESRDLDLALVVSETEASVGAAFSTNQAPAAHILAARPRVARGSIKGVLVSAGVANSGTGGPGVEDVEAMAAAAAGAVGGIPEDIVVCCTGKIGGRIPLDAVLPAIPAAAAALSSDGSSDASRAIMTTDTRPKESVRTAAGVSVGGMAKGAGMIAPELVVAHATMLAFITTDAVASPGWLRHVLADALPTTFNAITVDGSNSTNDTVLLMANGASGVSVEGSEEFTEAVREVMGDLAYAIVADGEGATKVIRIRVTGAASTEDAHIAARSVANSLLFRAAIWGGDPNWGRVVQSIGQTRVKMDPDRIGVRIAGVELARAGVATEAEASAAAGLLANEVLVEADLGVGDATFDVLTCDLTPEYVKFNADYVT